MQTTETKSKHTEGPWLAAATPSSVVGWPVVQPATGRVICTLNYIQHTEIDPVVAGDRAFNAESRANARLVAAAPELLEALKAAETACTEAAAASAAIADGAQIPKADQDHVAGLFRRAEKLRRAAIAKATGGK